MQHLVRDSSDFLGSLPGAYIWYAADFMTNGSFSIKIYLKVHSLVTNCNLINDKFSKYEMLIN